MTAQLARNTSRRKEVSRLHGVRIVFLRYDPPSRESRYMTATLEGAEERVLGRRRGPTSLLNPIWSAAGEIVTVARDRDGRYAVVAIDPSSTKERKIADGGWSFVNLLRFAAALMNTPAIWRPEAGAGGDGHRPSSCDDQL
jgi:hypothetical protein